MLAFSVVLSGGSSSRPHFQPSLLHSVVGGCSDDVIGCGFFRTLYSIELIRMGPSVVEPWQARKIGAAALGMNGAAALRRMFAIVATSLTSELRPEFHHAGVRPFHRTALLNKKSSGRLRARTRLVSPLVGGGLSYYRALC